MVFAFTVRLDSLLRNDCSHNALEMPCCVSNVECLLTVAKVKEALAEALECMPGSRLSMSSVAKCPCAQHRSHSVCQLGVHSLKHLPVKAAATIE